MTDGAAGRDVLITGPSRSGTTLTCELLNMVADAVALDEPMNAASLLGHDVPEPKIAVPAAGSLRRIASRVRHGAKSPYAGPPRSPPDPAQACDNVARFMEEARASLALSGTAISKNVGGRVLGKKVADEYDEQGRRVALARLGEIRVDKELSDQFLLAVKQTSGFIALLEALVERFEVYAVVRNPLAILSSWHALPFHPGDGHVRLGEGIDWDLRDRLADMQERTDRQFEILSWYFGRIGAFVPQDHVIRYEDVIATGGRALSVIHPGANELCAEMENRNVNRGADDREQARRLGERLFATPGPWWRFYSEDSVRAILAT